MKELNGNDFKICYIDKNEDILLPKTERKRFCIAKSDYDDIKRIQLLKKKGYRFLDRILRMEIATQGECLWEEKKRLIQFPAKCMEIIDDSVYEIACAAYDKDRRFHLQEEYKQEQANAVIKAYIEECKRNSMPAITCSYNESILGVTVLKDNMDGTMDNILGAVKPGLQGKMAAYGLYIQTLMWMKGQGCKRYYGNVSSSNIASLNLHIALGGKIVETYEEYILEEN